MIIIYTTCRSQREADQIARRLVTEKLCACTNTFPVRSVYQWKEKVMKNREVALVVKTERKFFKRVKVEIRKMHTYEAPCVLSVNIDRVDKSYRKWVRDSLKRGEK